MKSCYMLNIRKWFPSHYQRLQNSSFINRLFIIPGWALFTFLGRSQAARVGGKGLRRQYASWWHSWGGFFEKKIWLRANTLNFAFWKCFLMTLWRWHTWHQNIISCKYVASVENAWTEAQKSCHIEIEKHFLQSPPSWDANDKNWNSVKNRRIFLKSLVILYMS